MSDEAVLAIQTLSWSCLHTAIVLGAHDLSDHRHFCPFCPPPPLMVAQVDEYNRVPGCDVEYMDPY